MVQFPAFFQGTRVGWSHEHCNLILDQVFLKEWKFIQPLFINIIYTYTHTAPFITDFQGHVTRMLQLWEAAVPCSLGLSLQPETTNIRVDGDGGSCHCHSSAHTCQEKLLLRKWAHPADCGVVGRLGWGVGWPWTGNMPSSFWNRLPVWS